MAQIDAIVGALQKIKSSDVSVNPFRCVTVRNRRAQCRRCAEACTSGAISLDENAIQVQQEKCIGCGTCATACPTCALEAKHPNDEELRAAALTTAKNNGNVAVFTCRPMVEGAGEALDRSKVIGVECLGRVEESLLVELVCAGITKAVFVRGTCETCEHKASVPVMEQVTASTAALLDVWNHPVALESVAKFPGSVRSTAAPQFDEGRRSFFFSAKEATKDAALVVGDAALSSALGENLEEEPEVKVLKVMDDGTLPHFIPNRRERLLDGLAALGEPKDEMIATRLWGHVIIDTQLCNSCRMCATFCPTGAIAKFDEEGTMGIDHFPGDCVKCRCCEDICPTRALTISDEVFATDLLTGAVERIEMRPLKVLQSNPKKAMFTFRDLLGCEDIYER